MMEYKGDEGPETGHAAELGFNLLPEKLLRFGKVEKERTM